MHFRPTLRESYMDAVSGAIEELEQEFCAYTDTLCSVSEGASVE